MIRDECGLRSSRRRVEQSRHQVMEHCFSVRILRVSRALTCEPCSDRVRHPYRKRPQFRRQHRDRDHLGHRLGVRNHRQLEHRRHPERRRDAGNQHLQDVGHLRNHRDDQGHRHQPDDLRHQDHRHQPDVDHLDEECLDEVRPDDPCPVKVRMGCFLDG